MSKRINHKIINSVESKKCTICKKWMDISNFYSHVSKWDNLSTQCKDCGLKMNRKYKKNNPQSKEAKEKNNKARQIHKKNNPEKTKEVGNRATKKYRAKPGGRLHVNVSRAISHCLKDSKGGKHTFDILGYTSKQLIKHLTKTMPNNYTWNDYLLGKLHLDHIIPISVFNFEKPEDRDFKRCWALSNLQLLPAIENKIKNNKLERPFQPSLIFSKK